MPGGYSNQELSAESPIKAIAAFPQELVLLGRATILIKGIAKRLDINWDLARKWRPMAEQALNCGVDGCLMPTWSAAPSTAPKAEALVDGPVRFYVEGTAEPPTPRPHSPSSTHAPASARSSSGPPASASLGQFGTDVLAGRPHRPCRPCFPNRCASGRCRASYCAQVWAAIWSGLCPHES